MDKSEWLWGLALLGLAGLAGAAAVLLSSDDSGETAVAARSTDNSYRDELGVDWPNEQAREEYIRDWRFQEWLGPEPPPRYGSPYLQGGAPGTGKRA